MTYDTIIIGSGPAGYTAGIYTARAGLRTAIISGYQEGGQLTTTTTIENFPGFPEPIAGRTLMERMKEQCSNVGVIHIFGQVETITPNNTTPNTWDIFDGIDTYHTRTIILATGSIPKWSGKPGEDTWKNKGISTCATCDGAFYKNQDVAVIGGGNTALEEALYLANIAKNVHIIHRRDSFRAEHPLQQAIQQTPNIHIHWNNDILSFEGDTSLTHIITRTPNGQKAIAIQGAFLAIGHTPVNSLLPVESDSHGYIHTNNTHTSIPGIFAAGDVQDPIYRQAITAAASGCIAALEAHKFIQKIKKTS